MPAANQRVAAGRGLPPTAVETRPDRGVRKKQFTVRQIELAADVLRTKDWIDPGAVRSRS